jgi:hypothetical protein
MILSRPWCQHALRNLLLTYTQESYLPARSLRITPDAVQGVGRQQLSYASLLVTRQF